MTTSTDAATAATNTDADRNERRNGVGAESAEFGVSGATWTLSA